MPGRLVPPVLALRRAAPWVALAVVLCSAAAIRLRFLDVPLERDEGEYAYLGQQMLEGVVPFDSGYSMKLPGTAAAYAGAMAVFGETPQGIRLGLIVVNGLTLVFIFLLARLASGTFGAVAAAAAYAVLSISPRVLGPFAHANHFVNLFGVAGLWAFGCAVRSGRIGRLAGAGLLLGFAPVMKQSGAVFPAFAAAWLVWTRWRLGPAGRRALAREAAALTGASLVGLALTMGLLALSGVLPRAWYWVSTYARAYSGEKSAEAGLRLLRYRMTMLLPVTVGFVALALAGLVVREPGPREGVRPFAGRSFPAALLAGTFASACLGWYFRSQYFIPVLPAVALLCGRAAAALADGSRPLRWALAAAAIVASSAQSLAAQRDVLFKLSPPEISRAVYGENPFPEAVEVARYLRAHTAPTDRVAVLGSEPEILFYAHRRSATGYLYLYPLIEPNRLGPAMQQEFMSEVTAAAPAYIVWIDVPMSWDFRLPVAAPLMQWADGLISSRYVLDGRVSSVGPGQIEYAWGEEVARRGQGHGGVVLLFRRVVP